MQPNNVVLTCTGGRNSLAGCFANALGTRGQVYTVASRGEIGTPMEESEDSEFAERLLQLCRRHQVSMVVPLADSDLGVLARERARFAAIGTTVVVSRPEVIALCADRWATCEFLRNVGIETARTFLSPGLAERARQLGEVEFPLAVKPRWGGEGDLVEDVPELDLACHLAKKRLRRMAPLWGDSQGSPVVIQERLTGAEYGLDIINDFNGRYVGTLVRRKLRVRAGRTECAVSVNEPRLEQLGALIGQELGHIGILECEVFVEESHYRVLQLQPRFGDGYPFSHLAGANVPAFLLAQLRGEQGPADWLRVIPGIIGARAERLVEVPAGSVNALSGAIAAADVLEAEIGKSDG